MRALRCFLFLAAPLLLVSLLTQLIFHTALGQETPPEHGERLGPDSSSGDPDETAQEVAIRVITTNVRVLLTNEAYAEAISELERLLRRAPEEASVHLLAVEAYFLLGQDAHVRQHAARAAELDADSAEPYRWLARLARWRGDLKEARRQLKRALLRLPSSIPLRTELASLYEADGHRTRAQRQYKRALSGELEKPEAALEAALRTRNPDRRDDALRRLSERFPDHPRLQSWWSLCRETGGGRLWQAEPYTSPVSVQMQVDAQRFAIVRADIGAPSRVRLLLDTGTSGLKLSRRTAEAAGVETFGALRIGGMGDMPSARAELGLVETLRLGSLVLRNVPVTILDSLPRGDGLLNPSALGTEAARFDVSNRLLLLGDRADLVPEGVPPRPFFEVEEHPVVRLYLNGRPRQAMLDSGSAATIFDVSLVRQIPERRPMLFEGIDFRLSGILGEVKEARPIHVSRLGLGELVVENSILFEADLSRIGAFLGTEVQLLLGADYINRFDSTFDYRTMEVSLEPAKPRRNRRLRPDY